MYSKDCDDLENAKNGFDSFSSLREEASSTSITISFMNKVYGWMTAGLLLTTIVSIIVSQMIASQRLVLNPIHMIVCILLQFGLVWTVSAKATKLPPMVAIGIFLVYAALNGVTFSLIFFAYKLGSIIVAFYSATAIFGTMAVYGSVTKKDLTGLGSLCFMGLIGLIVAQIAYWITSFFIPLPFTLFNIVFSVLGIAIFIGLTAYDAQKIKQLSQEGENRTGVAICGALALYLDFVYLFLYLLRLFGDRR